jgi:hypothetical protein
MTALVLFLCHTRSALDRTRYLSSASTMLSIRKFANSSNEAPVARLGGPGGECADTVHKSNRHRRRGRRTRRGSCRRAGAQGSGETSWLPSLGKVRLPLQRRDRERRSRRHQARGRYCWLPTFCLDSSSIWRGCADRRLRWKPRVARSSMSTDDVHGRMGKTHRGIEADMGARSAWSHLTR